MLPTVLRCARAARRAAYLAVCSVLCVDRHSLVCVGLGGVGSLSLRLWVWLQGRSVRVSSCCPSLVPCRMGMPAGHDHAP